MAEISGKPIHLNGTAPISTGEYAEFKFTHPIKKKFEYRIKTFVFRVTGAADIKISFDNGNSWFTWKATDGVLSEDFMITSFRAKSVGAASTFEAIGIAL